MRFLLQQQTQPGRPREAPQGSVSILLPGLWQGLRIYSSPQRTHDQTHGQDALQVRRMRQGVWLQAGLPMSRQQTQSSEGELLMSYSDAR